MDAAAIVDQVFSISGAVTPSSSDHPVIFPNLEQQHEGRIPIIRIFQTSSFQVYNRIRYTLSNYVFQSSQEIKTTLFLTITREFIPRFHALI